MWLILTKSLKLRVILILSFSDFVKLSHIKHFQLVQPTYMNKTHFFDLKLFWSIEFQSNSSWHKNNKKPRNFTCLQRSQFRPGLHRSVSISQFLRSLHQRSTARSGSKFRVPTKIEFHSQFQNKELYSVLGICIVIFSIGEQSRLRRKL